MFRMQSLRSVRSLFSVLCISCVSVVRAQVPVVSSVAPLAGNPGTTVTIAGSGFNATAANNVVYFGATRAMVSAASATTLSVVVPNGATAAPVSVLNTVSARTGSSPRPFTPVYNNSFFMADSLNFKAGGRLFGGKVPVVAAIGDLDNDGLPDIVGVSSTDTSVLVVYHNNGGPGPATFTPVSSVRTVAYSHSVKISDIDGDGMPELIAANAGGASVTVIRNTSLPGSISFGASYNFVTAIQPMVVNVADIDMDGKPDLVVSCAASGAISILRNTSVTGIINSTTFATHVDIVAGAGAVGLAIADLDGDSKMDIAVANSSANNISLFRNIAVSGSITAASFAPKVNIAAGLVPVDVALADIDGDGRTDMIVANNSSHNISMFRNTSSSVGTLSFAAGVSFLSGGANTTGLAVSDMNGDGKLDIAVTNVGSNNVSLFRNRASAGAFSATSLAAPVLYATGVMPQGVSVGDLNSDGYPDMVVANNGDSTLSLFSNYPLPTVTAITGTLHVCQYAAGVAGVCASETPGGVWSVTDPTVAAIDLVTGFVTGILPGTTTIRYSVIAGGDTNTVSALVDVWPAPQAGTIAGNDSICAGAFTTFTGSVSGGVWSSSNSDIAAADAAGVVTGVVTGTATITYSVTNSCGTAVAVKPVVVSTLPVVAGIAGADHVYLSGEVVLADVTPGGVWSSSNDSVATITTPGSVSGVSVGGVIISYSVSNSCGTSVANYPLSVYPVPTAGYINGAGFLCTGSSITLADTVAGGAWSISDASVATIDASGLVNGISAGVATVSYTVSNGYDTVVTTHTLTVGQLPLAGAITGDSSICAGTSAVFGNSVLGGNWSVSDPVIAIVSTSGLVSGVSAGSAVVSYSVSNSCGTSIAQRIVTVRPLPVAATIDGASSVCAGASISLSGSVAGGVWSTSNMSIASVTPTGQVTGVAAGVATISYVTGNSCGTVAATRMITVNAVPNAGIISGVSTLCVAASATLTNIISGGVWSSSNTDIATIGTSGMVRGVSGGNVVISYTVGSVCQSVAVRSLTISPLPVSGIISGNSIVCRGATSVLATDGNTGGVWSSSSISVATVNASGTVYGVALGSATISYRVTSACGMATSVRSVTVATLPVVGSVSGATSVCAGSVISLTNSTVGGAWSSNNTVVASVNSVGMVQGISAGSVIISYSVSNSCGTVAASKAVTVNPLPVAGTISGINTLCRGSLMSLSADGAAGGVWSSSSTSKATVSSAGVVGGVAAGTATISYKVTNTCGTSVATFPVTVNAAPVVSSIYGSGSIVAGTSASFTDATTGGLWAVSNASLATVDAGGVVSALAVGSITLSYTVSNTCGATSVTKSVNITKARSKANAEPDNSVETSQPATHLLLYPNPNTGSFTLSLPASASAGVLVITDMQGREVMRQQYQQDADAMTVNMKQQVPGIYNLRVFAEGVVYSERFLVVATN